MKFSPMIGIAVAALVLALVSLGLIFGNMDRMLEGVDRIELLEQRIKAEEQLDGAVAGAVRISRSAVDVPPPITRRTAELVQVDIEAVELDGMLHDGTTYHYWTFDSTVPGPMIRVREGDTVELTLRNAENSRMAHNIDLHAVNGPGGGAAVTLVNPGEAKTFSFKALNPGLFIYHCAAPHIPTHIALGMYGLILVEPEEGLPPVDHEFYVVQSEIYTNSAVGTKGHAVFSAERLLDENPHWVVFNGQYQALTGDHALQAEVGDRVRIYIGNAGPNLISSFHVIGEIFDRVHPEGATEFVSNMETTLVPAGGSAWVEFDVDVPGEYVLVDHAISRALDKGALGVLNVTGDPNPEIFDSPEEPESKEEQSGYD
ncbi:MAG: copper-containing nitrite reductase [Thermaerobacterales bacterium]